MNQFVHWDCDTQKIWYSKQRSLALALNEIWNHGIISDGLGFKSNNWLKENLKKSVEYYTEKKRNGTVSSVLEIKICMGDHEKTSDIRLIWICY